MSLFWQADKLLRWPRVPDVTGWNRLLMTVHNDNCISSSLF